MPISNHKILLTYVNLPMEITHEMCIVYIGLYSRILMFKHLLAEQLMLDSYINFYERSYRYEF